MTSDLRIQGEVVVNSEQAESAFNRVGDKATQMAANMQQAGARAGKAVDQIGEIAKSQGDKFTRAESAIVASIKRVTLEAAKNQQALEKIGNIEFNIAAKGLDPSKFAGMLNVTRQVAEETRALSAAMNGVGTPALDKMGISAAQTAAALRGVPAQFTDIITSLQGGQAPLTVFLQQGGQLKDMFGGAGNAARALGGYVVGLVNPFTIAAAAAGALAFAYNQGSKEADAYNKALITTGNAAGTNAAQLKAYAQEISAVVGTQGKAAESLAALASTGKIGAESLKEAAQAAVQYERATGQALDKTADQFASLRNEPLAAVLKLNDSMNFLTDSTYKQIKSLEEQGKTAEAANVAQHAFADTLSGRAGEMERNLGTVERGWLAVKDAAKSAWDAILNVGRASTNVDQLAAVRKQIADRENQLANGGFGANGGGAAFGRPSQAATERLKAELSALHAQAAALEGVAFAAKTAAEAEAERAAAVKASTDLATDAMKYESDLEKQRRAVLSATEKYQTALAKGNLTAEQRNQLEADYLKVVSGITAVKEKKGGGARASGKSQAEKDAEAAAKAAAAYIQQLHDQLGKVNDLTAAERVLYDLQLGKVELTHAQKDIALGLAQEIDATKELEKQRARDLAAAQSQTSAQRELTDTLAQYARALDGFGMGRAEQERLAAISQITDKYTADIRRLDDERRSAQFGGKWTAQAQQQYDDELRRIGEFQQKALASYDAYHEQLKTKQGDWSLGAQSALRNYADESANVFAQTESMVTKAFGGMEDALVQFATTGKLDFKSLANSIIADLIRIQIRAAAVSFLSSMFPDLLGGWSSAGVQASGAVTSPVTGWGSVTGTALPGLASGGYTGPGGKHDPAGIVHAGEYVINAESTKKLGLPYLNKLNGYASGGLVGAPPAAALMGGGGNVKVEIINNGAPATATASRERQPDGSSLIRIVLQAVAEDMSSGGMTARATAGRFGLATQ